MPTQQRAGKKSLYVELPDDLDAALRSYCKERGLKLAEQIRLAIQRHLANPPEAPKLPPLPPITLPESSGEEPRPAARKGSKRTTKGMGKK